MKKKLFALAVLTTAASSFAAPISTPNAVSDTPIIGGSNGSCGTVDLTSATSDYKLQPCETAVISFKNATLVPLHIATDPDALYWVYSSSAGNLFPNNMIYKNAFSCIDWGVNWNGTLSPQEIVKPQYGWNGSPLTYEEPDGTVVTIGSGTSMDGEYGSVDGTNGGTVLGVGTGDSFGLGNSSGVGTAISYIDVLNGKTITQHAATFTTSDALSYEPYSIRHIACHWISPSSWTSLGTLTFDAPVSGYILIKRLH